MAFSDDATVKALIAQIGATDPAVSGADPLLIAALLTALKPTLNDALGDYGLALAVCHELALTARSSSGGVGPVISEKEGELSRTYADLSMVQNSYWQSTPYGARFWALAGRSLVRMGNRFAFGEDGPISGLPCDG